MGDRQILLIVHVVAGLLLVGVSLPLLMQKIRPNWLYGFRVQKTMNNPEVWYAANKYAAKRLIWSGISIVAASVGLYYLFPAISLDAYALGALAVFVVVFTIGLVQSFIYLKSL